MPFTLSHAIAAAPLRRLLGRQAVLSALVIGCWVPDLPYFLPLSLSRGVSHSTAGLFYYALPVGYLLYVLYHAVLKASLVALLPRSVHERLPEAWLAPRGPHVRRRAILLSLALGAASHLFWDAFTHGDAAGTRAVPWLQQVVFVVDRYPVHGFALAQHLSTVLGLALLALWVRRTLRRQPRRVVPTVGALSVGERVLVLSAIVAMSATAALAQGLYAAAVAENLASAHRHIGTGAIAGLQAFGVSVLGYGALWQLWQVRVRAMGAMARR